VKKCENDGKLRENDFKRKIIFSPFLFSKIFGKKPFFRDKFLLFAENLLKVISKVDVITIFN